MSAARADGTLAGFQQTVAALDYPMAVVTAARGDERSGCLVGFHTQCSIDPPRYLVLISTANHTFPVARASTHLGVHLVDVVDRGLAELFGAATGDQVDKFARCRWRSGPGGAPVLTDVRTWFVGRVRTTVDGGDHVGFVLDPVESGPVSSEGDRPFRQLGFQQIRGLRAGHEA